MNQTDPTAVLARIRQMADYWEQQLPEVIRTPAVVSALRAALEGAPAVVSPPTDPTALALLCDAESYLSALHTHTARHDHIGADLTCGGCLLRDRITAVLPTLAAAVSPPPDRAGLRKQIAKALVRYDWNAGLSGRDTPSEHHYGEADAVLAVLPTPDRADDRAALERVREYLEARLDQVAVDPAEVFNILTGASEPPLSPYYSHEACGFHWHGKDGMDIPMRDGQPVCPRCELRRLAAEAQQPAPPAGLSVEPVARLLAAADGLNGRYGFAPYDELPDAEQEQYREQAQQLLDRAPVAQQPAATAQAPRDTADRSQLGQHITNAITSALRHHGHTLPAPVLHAAARAILDTLNEQQPTADTAACAVHAACPRPDDCRHGCRAAADAITRLGQDMDRDAPAQQPAAEARLKVCTCGPDEACGDPCDYDATEEPRS